MNFIQIARAAAQRLLSVRSKRILFAFALLLVAASFIYFGRRPSKAPLFVENIHPGVNYYRGSTGLPNFTVYHLVEIDLSTPGLDFVASDPVEPYKFAAATVQDFAEDNQTQIAINANFFYPFYANHPFSYYPKAGDLVEVNGIVVTDGEVENPPAYKWPALCITDKNRAMISSTGRCPSGTVAAVSGNIQTMRDGAPIEFPNQDKLPRTVVAVDEDGDSLWFLIIDGRQSFYSLGATHEFGQKLLAEAGAYESLNLDGGGSTTLIIEQDGQQQLMNSAIHTRVVMRQRPVANHLGIRIQPDVLSQR
ncbi:MAG: phosphodiester glycosidase family protein [Chloroflexota bacterium]